VNAFFTAIMGPIVTGTPTSQGDSSPDMACTMITLCTTILAPFFGSILGEFNANANERIFVLSRPVSRETYLFAKIMSSLTITVVLAGFICLFIYISYVETLSLET
jgi:ABC-type transport system involved in multi-copper enzyme maturation permease subunit